MPDPEDALAWVHRGWDHLRLQRPIAAWASWNRALRIDPDQKAAQEALEILAAADDLPAAARAVYRYRPPIGDDRRARWDAHFRGRDLSDLEPAAEAFAGLADSDPEDSSARYNQALTLAWLGRNVEAVGALEFVVEVDAPRDFEAAVEAWILAEVLRHGGGAEELADDFNYVQVVHRRPGDPEPIFFLEPIAKELRTIPVPTEADAQIFEWFDWGDQDYLCTVIASAETLRFSTPLRWALGEVWPFFKFWRLETGEGRPLSPGEFATEGLGAGGDERWVYRLEDVSFEDGGLPYEELMTPLPLSLLDAAALAYRLPDGLDASDRLRQCREAIEGCYERGWVQYERRGLSREPGGLSPSAASRLASDGDLVTRAKLKALVDFREQLGVRPKVAPLYGGYPFDRLRHRLGLDVRDSSLIDPDDISCMSFAELDRLDPKSLDDDRLREAFDSSGPVDQDLNSKFMSALIDRNAPPFEGIDKDWYHGLFRPVDEAES